jgi:oligoribonuclease NrnB/cAMP/cGMP phosphodiesterase (DHH superfamily)
MKVKLFSHCDLDGVGCGIVGIFAFPDINISYCSYEDMDKIITEFINNKEYLKYDYIYITDLAIRKETVDLINNTHPENFKDNFMLSEMVQLFDHHATSLWMNENFWCKVVVEENGEATCGTSLFYNRLIDKGDLKYNKSLFDFTEIVRKYDTWLWSTKYSDTEPKKWNDFLYIIGRKEFIDYATNAIWSNDALMLDSFANKILNIEQKRIDSYVDYKNKSLKAKTVAGKKAGIVFAESYVSELGNSLANMHPELDFIIMVNPTGGISYRAVKDDIDLGADIASLFGGGGHKKSAGSELDKKLIDELIDKIFDEK